MKNFLTIVLCLILVSTAIWAQDEPYTSRRDKIFEFIGDDIAIIKNSGRDYTLPMDVNWNYYYLTGDDVEGSILILSGKERTGKIFRPENLNFTRIRDSIVNGLEVSHLSDIQKFMMSIPFSRWKTFYTDFSAWPDFEGIGLTPPSSLESIVNIRNEIHTMRQIKDDHEMELLTHAIESTAAGLVEVMKAAEPGMNEKDFELILKYKFEKAGCENLGFGIQAASGPNSTSVHYGANDRQTEPGDMMVFDVGARYGYYSADISRSFPVSGKFTKEQKDIYNLVLKAQKAAIEEIRPGGFINVASDKATEVLNQGLLELGLLTDLNQSWQHGFWIQHGFFHPIGLVVHDVGGTWGELEPGFITTVEPGLYFPENFLENAERYKFRNVDQSEKEAFLKKVKPVFEKYVNIGVRIEDDVYVTEDGHRIISAGVPKEVDEIEKLMKESSMFNNKDK
jgi:Xaa-Pro aminopeptidase